MKGKIQKVLTLFIVIGLIIAMAVINNLLPIKMTRSTGNLETHQSSSAEPIGTIGINGTNFYSRFDTYALHYGAGQSNMYWGFYDNGNIEGTTEGYMERLNNVYCVQTGLHASNETGYKIYDTYSFDYSDTEDKKLIDKYFGDEDHYHRFLYILENMYSVGLSGEEKDNMVNELNQKIAANLGKDVSVYSDMYASMVNQINGLDMSDYPGSPKVDVINVGTDRIKFNLFKGAQEERKDTYVEVNKVDNYLAFVQRLLLATKILQKDGSNNGGYGNHPASFIWKYYRYNGLYKQVGPVGNVTSDKSKSLDPEHPEYNPDNYAQNYANALIRALDNGYNSSSYDINKYKNFSKDNANVDHSNAVYDSDNNRIGPFTITNPYKYDISLSELKYGSRNITDYSFVTVDNGTESPVDINNVTNGDVYIKLNETFDQSDSLSARFHIDYGYIATSKLLVPNNDNGQLMVTVDKNHEEKNIEWSTSIEVNPDIALKKYIYAVNGSTISSRINDIDLSPLANNTSTNANYLMNKTPVTVNIGDTVTYAIRLFNEGKVNATAAEITDYLPGKMKFKRAYTDFNAANATGYDESNNITNTGTSSKIKLRNPNENYIAPYEDTDDFNSFMNKSQVIYIDCVVEAPGYTNYVYTNMAEITEYRMQSGNDIDSAPSNWNAPSSINSSPEWQNYSNGHSNENPDWFDNGFHNWGAQDNNGIGDDDDFDKVVVNNIDLALTKRIESKIENGVEVPLVSNGSTTQSGVGKSKTYIEIPDSSYDDVKNGTKDDLTYNMNKEIAHVQRGDQLVTVLTVYNEGSLNAVVKKIEDYSPIGLNFNKTKSEELASLNGQNITFKPNGKNITIYINNEQGENVGKELTNLNDFDNDPTAHKVDKYEIKLVFDVSNSANGKLYNSAAITEYGYVGHDSVYRSAYNSGVDKDSWGSVSSASLTGLHKANYTTWSNAEDLTEFAKNNIQQQDDDDMDVVEVDQNKIFDLSLRKYISKVEKTFNNSTIKTINYTDRIPEINRYSVDALARDNTAEYYHNKVKVITEKGDLVTYRIRVYNEGQGDDANCDYYGRATEITDYLPDGLEFVELESGNDTGWTASANGSKITLSYSGDKILPTNSIMKLANIDNNGLNEHDYYQEVGVVCRVTSEDPSKIITNRAAITEREAYEKVYTDETNYNLVLKTDVQDRDNELPDELDESPNVLNLENWYPEHVINEDTPRNYYPGEQDDDDFDTIYVSTYDINISKTDGTDILPGAEMKVLKYRSITDPQQDGTATELTSVESAITSTGKGDYTTIAPTVDVENDIYIIKEIQAPDGYYNPFDGKYIKVTLIGSPTGVSIKNQSLEEDGYWPTNIDIYQDNGDDDYTNDTRISYSRRDPESVYNYVTVRTAENSFSIEIRNKEIVKDGTYHVHLLKKKAGSSSIIGGVHFTATAHINGVNETIASDDNPITTQSDTVTFIKRDVPMSEEKITDNDTYTLTEKDVGTNTDIYVGITNPIELTVEKDIDTTDPSHWKYIVTNVTMKIGTQTVVADSDGETITLDNGAKVTIQFTNGIITITAENPTKSGTFKLNLVKRKYHVDGNNDGTDDPLQGAKFNVKVNDGTSDIKTVTNQVTNADGEIPEISNIPITAGDLTYTITVEETYVPDGYIGLDGPITFTAKSKADGSSYVLDTSEQPTIDNEFIQAEVSEGEILIEAENRVEPVIHKGVKTVENQDSGYDKNEIQKWVINTTIPAGIATYTNYSVTDEIDPEKSNVDEKRIKFVNEDHPGQNVVVKIKGTSTVLTEGTDYKVNFYKVADTSRGIKAKTLEIIFINATDGNGNFVGGRSIPEKSTLEITFNTQFALDNSGNIIGINQSIPNTSELHYGVNPNEIKTKISETPEVHTGELRIFKYDNETNTALEGAHFKLTKTEAEANRAVQALLDGDDETLATIDFVKAYDANGNITTTDLEAITGNDGKTAFKGLEFGEDAQGKVQPSADPTTGASVYRYNWENVSTTYYIVETQVPSDYILLDHCVAAEVKYGEISETDLTGYHKIGNDKITYEGEYNVQIIKYGINEGANPTPLAGVKFSADRTVNGLAKETLTVNDTDATGKTAVGNTVVIANDKVSETDIDVYNITEVSVPATSEYYVGLNKNIKLSIAKQATESQDGTHVVNSVKSITMEITGETVNRVSDTKSTATVTVDGQELVMTVELVDNTITLTMQNPHKTGSFDLDIIKLLKGSNPKQYLTGAGFKVSVKVGDEYVKDGNGDTLDGTHEYFVGTQGDNKGKLFIEDIAIKKAGTEYSFEIEESTVPTGYIGISDKIRFTATSKVYDNKLGLTTDEIEVSNDVIATVGEDEIWVDVENKPEPVIHKGVEAVDNMDSGYDKDEIHTWVSNSTIPVGIADYTKYVITDEIDPEKSNVDEKRIEFINEDNPSENVVVKIKGTDTVLTEGVDYKANFYKVADTSKGIKAKTLELVFINATDGDDNFVGGRALPENSTLEITFHTKFRLDENGKIIGINQSIPNQQELHYGVSPDDVKTKKSEIPEIHTGGVGVFKYDEKTNKALEGAHFVITRNKTLADRAAKAVLDGNTEELNRLLASNEFVKVRNDEGEQTSVNVEAITGEDGRGKFEGLEFGENAMDTVRTKSTDPITGAEVYRYDWTKVSTKYYMVETVVPKGYKPLQSACEVTVKYDNYDELDLTEYYRVANTPKIYDLSLRKFITKVNDKDITDREPKVTLTDDFKSGNATTAKYDHTKNPLVVQQGNLVTYTIRIYNEGPEDAYASKIMDDIPEGLELVAPTFDDEKATNTNAEYRWITYREMTSDEVAIPEKMIVYNNKSYIVEKDVKKADLIVTDYLSMDNGKVDTNGINQNLIKGYDKDTMSELDYRDVKVQFKVTEPNTSDRILTNYAQISEMSDDSGDSDIEDRDSTPNEWIEDEDDQDIENLKLLYFDLALRKWVTKAIVTENGKTVVTETGHHAEDDPEAVVKVDLKKSKVNSVVVKFEYQIRITNQGKIGGWCDEIKDHIPNGLRFEQADNPTWTQLDEKTIVTDALKDTYLEPDESAEVTVVLTWENSGTNLGIKTNIAEISKDRNEYDAHDIDSTPDNYKWGEDDIDDAPVMLSLKTGNQAIICVAIIAGVIAIVGLGVYYIKKID